MARSPFTCLWFDHNGQEAADFYCSVFQESRILSANPIVIMIELLGTRIMLLNGGPMFKPSEAASLVVECKDQQEIDHYWNNLSRGGEEQQCGWLKDRFGISWQIVPEQLPALLSDPVTGPGVQKAFLTMKKFDLNFLLEVASGKHV